MIRKELEQSEERDEHEKQDNTRRRQSTRHQTVTQVSPEAAEHHGFSLWEKLLHRKTPGPSQGSNSRSAPCETSVLTIEPPCYLHVSVLNWGLMQSVSCWVQLSATTTSSINTDWLVFVFKVGYLWRPFWFRLTSNVNHFKRNIQRFSFVLFIMSRASWDKSLTDIARSIIRWPTCHSSRL